MMAIVSSVLVGISVFLLVRVTNRHSDSALEGLVPSATLQQAERELPPGTIAATHRIWLAVLIAIAVIGWIISIIPVAIALAAIWLLTPRWYLAWSLHRRRMVLRDQLVGCTQALANAARAGQSLAQGLDSVARESQHPLEGELRRLMAEYQLGRPLPDTLLEAKQRLKLDSFSMFASTIVVSLQRGGRVTEALERISRSLRENQRIERKLAAETAGGWRVVLILTLFPFLFLAGFYVLHPEGTMLMFQSLVGQSLLILIIGLVVVSVWWSRKILNVEL